MNNNPKVFTAVVKMAQKAWSPELGYAFDTPRERTYKVIAGEFIEGVSLALSAYNKDILDTFFRKVEHEQHGKTERLTASQICEEVKRRRDNLEIVSFTMTQDAEQVVA